MRGVYSEREGDGNVELREVGGFAESEWCLNMDCVGAMRANDFF